MEIEAKFLLPNEEAAAQLSKVDRLGDYSLSTPQVREIRDTYLDTLDRRILRGGYACRRRERPGDVLYTLKSLEGGKGLIHRREELEFALPAVKPLREWPPGPTRDKVFTLIGTASLKPLFHLRQERMIRAVYHQDREVAEFSLDRVRLAVEERIDSYMVLEIELVAQGTERDLQELVASFQQRWNLPMETRSKFEKALAFLGSANP